MKTGTKVKLKKGFEHGIITFEEGDILKVANYIHKSHVYLKHDMVVDLVRISYEEMDEYFEVLAEVNIFAELEETILKHYLNKGFKLSNEQSENDAKWNFIIRTKTQYKRKEMYVFLIVDGVESIVFYIDCDTIEEMFDKAFKFFRDKATGIRPDLIIYDDIIKDSKDINPDEVFKKVGYSSEEHY